MNIQDVRKAIDIIDAETKLRASEFRGRSILRQQKLEEMNHVRAILVIVRTKLEEMRNPPM